MPYELTRREVVCGGLILAVSGGGSRDLHRMAYAGSGLAFAGVNLAGAEFGKVPGTYATDYTYPAPASIDYFSQLGFNLIRVPFRWERLQPTLGSPFAATDLALLSSVVDCAASKGLRIVLDTHNYARRRVSRTAGRQSISSDRTWFRRRRSQTIVGGSPQFSKVPHQ